MKARHILVVLGALLFADFSFAQTLSQSGSGVVVVDATSTNYSMKAAVADPGVGQSQSANYIYDHGTLWAAGASTATPPIVPPGEGGIGGDGGSGSGWDEWWDIEDPDLGVSPVTPEKSVVVEKVITAVREIASPEIRSIPIENFSKKVIPWIVEKCPNGCVVVGVSSENGIQEVAVTLVKRVLPWPFWVVILLIILGILAFVGFGVGMLTGHRVVWGAGATITVALVAGIWMRYHYRAAYRAMDFTSIVDARVVSPEQADAAVRAIAEELVIGGHTVTVLGSQSSPQVMITVYVKKALPI